ncbi:sensor histidine kinase [Chloroflexota bacterium]
MSDELVNYPSPEQVTNPELTPEEAAFVLRIGVFVRLRWIAIGGVLIASLLATRVFNINFPLLPIYIICACMILYNIILSIQAHILNAEASNPLRRDQSVSLRRLLIMPKATSPLMEQARAIGNIHIVLDLLALTTLLHFTGGIENPFIFYFVFHVIIAGILLNYRMVYFLTTLVLLILLLLVGLEYSGMIPHVHLEGFISADLYQQDPYIWGVLIALISCLYGSAYMVTNISGELRKRQREVVVLQEEGLLKKTKELEEANEELGRLEESRKNLLNFLAIASHDLKAPLSAVQSYLRVILGGFVGKISEKQKHMMERSSQRINELLELISDLLDISRIEGGQILREVDEVSLAQVLADSVASINVLAKDKKIKLRTEIPEVLPQIQVSSIRIQQVVTNLLSNAIKFTPEKGAVKLRASHREADMQVEVLDTGVGISAEELPRVFEDFYRGSDKEAAGTGLGLSIVKRIVEAYGGEVIAESPNPEEASARGSKFTFTLPGKLVTTGKRQNKRKASKEEETSAESG